MLNVGERAARVTGAGDMAAGWTSVPGRPSINDEFITALISGGDNRLSVDARTGANKYLCPPAPAADLICASSCTASPITERGFERASRFYSRLIATSSAARRVEEMERCRRDIEAHLLGYFGVAAMAEAILCPSGTDALLTAAALLAGERPGEAITAILPVASETGTGVPLAVSGRRSDEPARSDYLFADCTVRTVEIPLRSGNGQPHSDDQVADAYAAVARGVHGRPIVYLTHSTKTGLVAPVRPPSGIDVIVDACQGRIESPTVAGYLRQGWPVAVSGSKFFGGPAFSGAVLFPTARLPGGRRQTPLLSRHRHFARSASLAGSVNLGTLLRWIAARDAIEAFVPLAGGMASLLRNRAAAVERGLSANAALVPVGGLVPGGSGWSELPSIFTFAVRDAGDRHRLLSAAELRAVYQRLANEGVLLGQPVELGRFGGLRIAVGARDLLAAADGGLPRVFSALEEVTRS